MDTDIYTLTRRESTFVTCSRILLARISRYLRTLPKHDQALSFAILRRLGRAFDYTNGIHHVLLVSAVVCPFLSLPAWTNRRLQLPPSPYISSITSSLPAIPFYPSRAHVHRCLVHVIRVTGGEGRVGRHWATLLATTLSQRGAMRSELHNYFCTSEAGSSRKRSHVNDDTTTGNRRKAWTRLARIRGRASTRRTMAQNKSNRLLYITTSRARLRNAQSLIS